jgi:hypothetical protein
MLGAIIDLENAGIPVRFAYDIYEEQTGKVMVKKKGGNYYLAILIISIRRNNFIW